MRRVTDSEDPAARSFASRLLDWFGTARRDLPWRRTRDPWAIWVSEVMLQQTRVEAVREPFVRFLASYPRPADFAAVDDDELARAWRGLGYYRRARLLRDGARAVRDRHDGEVPSELQQLAALPGVGPYTLGALGSIAFGHAEPAVDGNVERVASRHRGLEAPIGTGPARRTIREVVLGWIDAERAGDFNQALMELGATVCTPTSPKCGACPVAADCVARRDGRTDQLPVRRPRRESVDVTARVVLAVRSRGGRREALGYRVPVDQPNAGQVELPGPGVLVDCDPDDLADALRERFGAQIEPGPEFAFVRHAITHHRITLHAHTATTIRAAGSLAWFDRGDETPWTTPSRKVFGRADALEA